MTADNQVLKEEKFHRHHAAATYNMIWDLLEKKDRTNEENLKMLELAFASKYHWSFIGGPTQKAMADWMISRVLAKLKQGEMAIQFAEACLNRHQNELKDFLTHLNQSAFWTTEIIALEKGTSISGKIKTGKNEQQVFLNRPFSHE